MNEIFNISFEAFWEIYPRKTGGKPNAERKFNSLSDADKYNAIAGAKHHRDNNPQWRNKALIPHATTYLNQSRWLDEIVEEKTAKDRVVENHDGSNVDLVWSAMAQMYGDSWIKRHGEKPPEIWQKMLKNLPIARLKRGLRAALDAHSDFPPSLPKFMEYCAPSFEEQYPTALPKPKGDRLKALESLEEMKKLLGVE
jgi:hypothetical protein